MRKKALLVGTIVMFSWLPVWGQETLPFPRGAVFATYSHFNIDGGDVIPRSTINGRGFGLNANFHRFWGATVEVLGGAGSINESFVIQRTGVEISSADIVAQGFLAGPELSYRGKNWRPFAHARLGPVHYTLKNLSIRSRGRIIPMPELKESETNLGWGAGAGLDLRITPAFAVRMFQLDYIVEKSDPIRRHYRLAFGVVGSFGGRK